MSFVSVISRLFGTYERPSPSNWLPENAVRAWADALPFDKLKVKLSQKPKIWLPMIPDTNSMDGAFDIGNNNILIAGTTPADHAKLVGGLEAGDIAVYRTARLYAIHRIVQVGSDNLGKFYRFRGDNNPCADPDRVRENQVLWVSIGTIY